MEQYGDLYNYWDQFHAEHDTSDILGDDHHEDEEDWCSPMTMEVNCDKFESIKDECEIEFMMCKKVPLFNCEIRGVDT